MTVAALAPGLEEFLVCQEQLAGTQADEKEPYKHLYQVSQNIQQKIDQFRQEPVQDEAISQAIAVLSIKKAVTDLQTDEPQATIYPLINENIQKITNKRPDIQLIKVEGLNWLGTIHFSNESYEEADAVLQQAEGLGDKLRKETQDSIQQQFEQEFIKTVYYRAQVFAKLGNKTKSAEYCAFTLYNQQRTGILDYTDWLQNCAQLAIAFYVGNHMFASAKVCLMVADQVLETAKSENKDIEDDVVANIAVAWGKYYSQLLEDGHCMHILNSSVDSRTETDHDVRESLWLYKVLTHEPMDLEYGLQAAPSNFEKAREICNQGTRQYRAALDYYVLDGHVNTHVECLFDISNMYKYLSGFERDPLRVAAIHQLRVKQLDSLVGQLSEEHYGALVKSISLELGDACREIANARQDAKEQPSKIVSQAKKALAHYSAFLSSYKIPKGKYLPPPQDMDEGEIRLLVQTQLNVMHTLRKIANNKSDIKAFVTARDLSEGLATELRLPEYKQQYTSEADHCTEFGQLMQALMQKIQASKT